MNIIKFFLSFSLLACATASFANLKVLDVFRRKGIDLSIRDRKYYIIRVDADESEAVLGVPGHRVGTYKFYWVDERSHLVVELPRNEVHSLLSGPNISGEVTHISSHTIGILMREVNPGEPRKPYYNTINIVLKAQARSISNQPLGSASLQVSSPKSGNLSYNYTLDTSEGAVQGVQDRINAGNLTVVRGAGLYPIFAAWKMGEDDWMYAMRAVGSKGIDTLTIRQLDTETGQSKTLPINRITCMPRGNAMIEAYAGDPQIYNIELKDGRTLVLPGSENCSLRVGELEPNVNIKDGDTSKTYETVRQIDMLIDLFRMFIPQNLFMVEGLRAMIPMDDLTFFRKGCIAAFSQFSGIEASGARIPGEPYLHAPLGSLSY